MIHENTEIADPSKKQFPTILRWVPLPRVPPPLPEGWFLTGAGGESSFQSTHPSAIMTNNANRNGCMSMNNKPVCPISRRAWLRDFPAFQRIAAFVTIRNRKVAEKCGNAQKSAKA
jgi:hypothetical protein